uniref:CYCLIN domain-containing protein n=1 Tax=Panagrellus redivivus TaxID=6233 RepID=A0A7E4W021_PANRE
MASHQRVLTDSTNYQIAADHFNSSMFHGSATSSTSTTTLMGNVNLICEESIQTSPSTSLGQFTIHDNSPRPIYSATGIPGRVPMVSSMSNAIKAYSGPLQGSPSLNRKRRADAQLRAKLNRQSVPAVPATVDQVIHEGSIALRNLRANEKHFVPSFDGFVDHQCEIDSNARRLTVEWLGEVCDELLCDPIIFPLTVNLFDRLMAQIFVPRASLQAFASACLLLAGKVKAPNPMSAIVIADYSDGGVAIDALLDCEITVILSLGWQLYTPTALDFLDQMLIRCPGMRDIRKDFPMILRKVLQDHNLACLKPSEQALFISGYLGRACGDSEIYTVVESCASDLFDMARFDFIKGVADIARLFPDSGVIKLIESEIAKPVKLSRARKSSSSVKSIPAASPGAPADDEASPCKQQRLETSKEAKSGSTSASPSSSSLKGFQVRANSVAARLLRSVSSLSNTARALTHKSPASTNRRWSIVSQDSGVCSEVSSPEVSRLSLGLSNKPSRRSRKNRYSTSS